MFQMDDVEITGLYYAHARTHAGTHARTHAHTHTHTCIHTHASHMQISASIYMKRAEISRYGNSTNVTIQIAPRTNTM